MPELPEVESLARFLGPRVNGRSIERCEVAAIAALKTVDPPLAALLGRRVESVTRRGKYLCFDTAGMFLVLHLARAGWLRWRDVLPAAVARPGRSPLALRVGISGGGGFEVTEAGREKRLAVFIVRHLDDVEGIARLGPDPLDPGFDLAAFTDALAGETGTVKTALTRQSLIAGVGNAYSDEALHRARLSPFKSAAHLDPDELARLHGALVAVLAEGVEASRDVAASELKAAKRRVMQVHGRTGEICPVCGDTVREVAFATRSLQYCARCQTGGRPLADRRLSRLLK